MAKNIDKIAKAFGKKEKVLNYTSNTYQLTRPNKVGAVMSLIRECQPAMYKEWETYYFDNAWTKAKEPVKITEETLVELGERLYAKVVEVVIPEWTEAFKGITQEDCIEYIREVTLTRTYDGYVAEKSVIHDDLEKRFPEVQFQESDPELDHAGDIDYLGFIGEKAFGVQIKPVSAQGNFGNYKITERMAKSFERFSEQYRGKVFVIFSGSDGNKKVIKNQEVITEITQEIQRLKDL